MSNKKQTDEYQDLEEGITMEDKDLEEEEEGETSKPLDPIEEQNKKRWVLIRAVLGEMLCTFLFVYVLCATSANFLRLKSPANPVVGALSTGFAAVALIYSFADVSGAHFNPAVTFATCVTRKTSITKGLMYVGAQLVGSVLAALILLATFPGNFNEGVNAAKAVAIKPASDANIGNAFLTELVLTFILVYVIFAVAFDTVDDGVKTKVVGKSSTNNLTIYTTSGQTKAGFAPIAIGFTLGFLCFLGGSVSGGAFNPARVFGTSLVGNDWTAHWMYWIADFLGAGLAGFTQIIFSSKKLK